MLQQVSCCIAAAKFVPYEAGQSVSIGMHTPGVCQESNESVPSTVCARLLNAA